MPLFTAAPHGLALLSGGATNPVKAALKAATVAYYRLEEASGTRVDATGRGNDLSATNTPGNTAGKIGNAVLCVLASSQRLSRASTADLTMGHSDFALWGWFNLTTAPGTRMLLAGKASSTNAAATVEYGIEWDGTSRLRGLISDGTTLTSVTASNFGAVPTATWLFVALTYDSVNNLVGIEVNRGTRNTAAQSTGAQATAQAFCIGAATATSFYDGAADEVGVIRRLPTNAELDLLYNNGTGRGLYP